MFKEAEFLQKLLAGYYMNLQQVPLFFYAKRRVEVSQLKMSNPNLWKEQVFATWTLSYKGI